MGWGGWGYVVSCPAMRKMKVLPMISWSCRNPCSSPSPTSVAECLTNALNKFCPSLSFPNFLSRSRSSRIYAPNSSYPSSASLKYCIGNFHNSLGTRTMAAKWWSTVSIDFRKESLWPGQISSEDDSHVKGTPKPAPLMTCNDNFIVSIPGLAINTKICRKGLLFNEEFSILGGGCQGGEHLNSLSYRFIMHKLIIPFTKRLTRDFPMKSPRCSLRSNHILSIYNQHL